MCNFISTKIKFYPEYIRKNNIVISVSYLKVNNDILIISYNDKIDMTKLFSNCKRYESNINNFYLLKIKKGEKYYNIINNIIYNRNKIRNNSNDKLAFIHPCYINYRKYSCRKLRKF